MSAILLVAFSRAAGVPPPLPAQTAREASDHGFIGTIVIGLLGGIIAKLLMPGRDTPGFHHHNPPRYRRVVSGHVPWTGNDFVPRAPAGLIGGVVGAFILLLLYRLIVKRN